MHQDSLTQHSLTQHSLTQDSLNHEFLEKIYERFCMPEAKKVLNKAAMLDYLKEKLVTMDNNALKINYLLDDDEQITKTFEYQLRNLLDSIFLKDFTEHWISDKCIPLITEMYKNHYRSLLANTNPAKLKKLQKKEAISESERENAAKYWKLQRYINKMDKKYPENRNNIEKVEKHIIDYLNLETQP